jgi:hypothetical protein
MNDRKIAMKFETITTFPSILAQKKVDHIVTFTIAKIEQPINGSPEIVYNTST